MPTTESGGEGVGRRPGASEEVPRDAEVAAGTERFDAEGGVYTLFFSVPREQIAYFKLMIEAYEGIGVGRTLERFHDEAGTRALVVVMVVPDFLAVARALLESLVAETGSRVVRATDALCAQLHRDLGISPCR